MKKKEFQEMKGKSIEALKEEVLKLRKEAETSFIRVKSGREKNTSVIRNTKGKIAKILTLIKEKELLGQEEKTSKI